jgi:hypothetical protein
MQETQMLEREAHEENKENNPWILVLVILTLMREQVSPRVS